MAFNNAYYIVKMFPPAPDPGPGNTNLFVQAWDEHGLSLPGVTVTETISGGATTIQVTDSAGLTRFVVPNNTMIYLTGKKTGYQTVTKSVQVGPGTSKFVSLSLLTATVTTSPTRTPNPGETTPRPTYDPDDPANTGNTNAKAQGMMNWLAMNGLSLVQLCFLITILALIGVKFGGK
jgi:hypothetical protein